MAVSLSANVRNRCGGRDNHPIGNARNPPTWAVRCADPERRLWPGTAVIESASPGRLKPTLLGRSRARPASAALLGTIPGVLGTCRSCLAGGRHGLRNDIARQDYIRTRRAPLAECSRQLSRRRGISVEQRGGGAGENDRCGIAHRNPVLLERQLDQPIESSPDGELLPRHGPHTEQQSHRELVEAVDALIIEWVEDPRPELFIGA